MLGTTPTTSALRLSRRISRQHSCVLQAPPLLSALSPATRRPNIEMRQVNGLQRRLGPAAALYTNSSMRLSPLHMFTPCAHGMDTGRSRSPSTCTAIHLRAPRSRCCGTCRAPTVSPACRNSPKRHPAYITPHIHARRHVFPALQRPGPVTAAMQRPVRRCGALHGIPTFLTSCGKGFAVREHGTASPS